MKIHTMIMTGMLSLCITQSSLADDTIRKDMGADCQKAEECKSSNCTANVCAKGNKKEGDKCEWSEECNGNNVICTTSSANPNGKCIVYQG